ncbi:MAG: hypothetical protein PHD32_12165, partial [Eubacteriales bacterium]|nr:hypothetical protein [Eubacteriales bacterium]
YGNPITADAYLKLPSVAQGDTAEALTVMMVFGSLAQAISPVLYDKLIGQMQQAGAFAALWPVMAFLAADALVVALMMRSRTMRKDKRDAADISL